MKSIFISLFLPFRITRRSRVIIEPPTNTQRKRGRPTLDLVKAKKVTRKGRGKKTVLARRLIHLSLLSKHQKLTDLLWVIQVFADVLCYQINVMHVHGRLEILWMIVGRSSNSVTRKTISKPQVEIEPPTFL